MVFNCQRVDMVCQKANLVVRNNIKGSLGHKYEILNEKIKAHNSGNCSRYDKRHELNGEI